MFPLNERRINLKRTQTQINMESQSKTCHRCGAIYARQVTIATLQETSNERLMPFLGKNLCDPCRGLIKRGADLSWKNIPIGSFEALRYAKNNRLFIAAYTRDGEELVRITTNLPDEELDQAKREIFIKNWSENEGLYNWLVAHCLVEKTGIFVSDGWAIAPLVKMTDRLMKLLELTDEDLLRK